MPHRDDQTSLRQMLEHACEAVALVQGRSRQDLDLERVVGLALLQLLQILGEAAGRVSPSRQAQHPEILWGQIVALRNRLIHGYDIIDFDIVWRIAHDDLPPLIAALENILASA